MAVASLVQGDLINFRVWCTSGAQASVNTFWYLCGLETGTVDLNQAAAAFDSLIATMLKGIIASTAAYKGVQCYVKRTPIPNPGKSVAGAGVGTATGSEVAPQICGLTRWNTDFAGAGFRGRTYWPFPTTVQDAVGGIPTSTYLTAIGTLATAIQNFALINPGGGDQIVVGLVLHHSSRKVGPVPAPTAIDANSSIPLWATMRKRGNFGRPNSSPI
jgi:hypothetical protein